MHDMSEAQTLTAVRLAREGVKHPSVIRVKCYSPCTSPMVASARFINVVIVTHTLRVIWVPYNSSSA